VFVCVSLRVSVRVSVLGGHGGDEMCVCVCVCVYVCVGGVCVRANVCGCV